MRGRLCVFCRLTLRLEQVEAVELCEEDLEHVLREPLCGRVGQRRPLGLGQLELCAQLRNVLQAVGEHRRPPCLLCLELGERLLGRGERRQADWPVGALEGDGRVAEHLAVLVGARVRGVDRASALSVLVVRLVQAPLQAAEERLREAAGRIRLRVRGRGRAALRRLARRLVVAVEIRAHLCDPRLHRRATFGPLVARLSRRLRRLEERTPLGHERRVVLDRLLPCDGDGVGAENIGQVCELCLQRRALGTHRLEARRLVGELLSDQRAKRIVERRHRGGRLVCGQADGLPQHRQRGGVDVELVHRVGFRNGRQQVG